MIREAFGTLGYQVQYRYRPDKRSIKEANSGMADGDFLRMATIVDDYPNVVVVPEALAQLDIVAFTIDPKIDLTNYQINQHQYLIGYLSGWKNVADLVDSYPNKTAVGEHVALFKLLIHGRIDVVLFTQDAGETILKALHNYNYQISSSLFSYPVYLVLNQRHSKLALPLAAKIKKLKNKYLYQPSKVPDHF